MSYTEIGEWSGKPLFKCDDCNFRTVSTSQRDKHDLVGHPRERAPLTKILGPDGEPVQAIPVPEEPKVVADENTAHILKSIGVSAEDVVEATENDQDGSTSEDVRPWWRRSTPDKETAQ